MSLDSDLKAYTKVALDDAHKIVKKVVNDVMVQTVDKTSVDSGALKNSWYASFGSPISAENGRSPDGSGADSLNNAYEVTSKINKSKIGEPIFFTNSLHYAQKIELGGFSRAPAGMMRIAVKNAVRNFK